MPYYIINIPGINESRSCNVIIYFGVDNLRKYPEQRTLLVPINLDIRDSTSSK